MLSLRNYEKFKNSDYYIVYKKNFFLFYLFLNLELLNFFFYFI